MLVKQFTGVKEVSSLLFHKPISQIVVVEEFFAEDLITQQDNKPYARVRLVDGTGGSSSEVVPKMMLSHLSELSSKYEGFDVRAGSAYNIDKDMHVMSGCGIYTVIVGALNDQGRFSCVDLSNQKYFDLELSGLHEKARYSIYGIEGYEMSSFVRKYSSMYLSRDEKQKNIVAGDNELLVLPLVGLEEVQFYAKSGKSFTMTQFELEHDAYRNNDIALAYFTRGLVGDYNDVQTGKTLFRGVLTTTEIDTSGLRPAGIDRLGGNMVNIDLGFKDLTVIPLTDIESFDIRRPAEAADVPYTFYMVDTRIPN